VVDKLQELSKAKEAYPFPDAASLLQLVRLLKSSAA